MAGHCMLCGWEGDPWDHDECDGWADDENGAEVKAR